MIKVLGSIAAGRFLSVFFLAILLACGNAFAARITPNDGSVLEGVFSILYGDPKPESGQASRKIYLLYTDDGQNIELDLDGATVPSAGIASMVKQRIRVVGEPLAVPFGAPGRFRVRDARSLEPAGTSYQTRITGSQPYVSLLCKFSDIPTEPRAPSYFTGQLGTSFPGFNHYFREVSYNVLNLDGSAVTPAWVTLPHPHNYYIDGIKAANQYLGELFDDCTAAATASINFAGFFGINMMFNGTLENAAWGGHHGAVLDGVNKGWPVTWMPYWGEADAFGWRTHGILAHEMSHSFGAPHSESPDGNEYGNWWDVVSKPGATCATVDVNYGCVGQSQNAHAKTMMGIMPTARVASHIFGTQSYDVERLSQPANAVGTYAMVTVNIVGSITRHYTVESRFRVGYDGQLPGDGVIIHEIDTARASGNPARLVVPGGGTGPGLGDIDARWAAGSTFTSVADNVSITVNSISGTGTANISVTTPAAVDTFPPSCVMPAGWTTPAGATTGWSVAADTAAAGSCSLKSNAMGDSPTVGPNNKAQIQFQGTFSAGNVAFQRRVSSEAGWDCLRFYIDGVLQTLGGTCNYGGSALSGEIAWGLASIPITAGAHTLVWSYEKDEVFAQGADAAWIDSVDLPLASAGTVGFALASYTVNENAGTVTVSVDRTPSFANAGSVTWTTSDGTAVAGQDFGVLGNSAQRTGTLTWAAGDGATKSFTVPILQNTAVEDPESFTITLSAPTGSMTLGATSVATVTILDDDSLFDFGTAALQVPENGPNVTLTVTRTGSLNTAANVTYTTANGTAIAGADFGTAASTVQPTGVLSFGVGVGSRTIAIGPTAVAAPYIPVINDLLIEPSKSFSVALSAPTGGGQLGATTSATVTIDSDDRGITMAAATQTVAESAGTALVQVNRSGSSVGSMSVSYAFANGTAVIGTNYSGTPGILTWADGDAAPKYIPAGIIDNAVVNANRTFTVTLSTPVNATIGTPAATTVTIADDDNTLQFSATTSSVSEAAASVNLTVSRLGGAAGAASVSWSTANGTAVSGADFGVSGNPASVGGILNWGPGDSAAKTITIPILADTLIEGDETFTVTLSGASGTGTSLGALSSTTVTIMDDDSGVTFASPIYSVIESGPMVSVQVQRIGNAAAAIGVTWTTANGTAIAGQDFGTTGVAAQRTGMLSWAAGDATVKTITVGVGGVMPVINDTLFEGSEDFTITLSAPTGGAALGPTPTTTVTIVDDESNFQFAQPGITVSEAGPNVTLNVTRTGSLATAANVTYATAPGTALAPSDYAATTGVLTFAVGESVKTITIGPAAAAVPYIAIVNDTLIEGPEQFTITLSAPTGGGQLAAPSTATVTIDSDDRGISMAAATQTVAENAGSVGIQVVRSGSSSGAMSVNYAFTNGTATNGTHFTGTTPGVLNWADGDVAPKTITAGITDDTAVNTNRTFTVTLSSPVGAVLGATISTVVTIADNDNTLQFAPVTYTVAESVPTVSITVTRVGGAAGAASVNWSTTNSTAVSGSDFGISANPAPVGGTLNWAAGDSAAKILTIPILNDTLIEGNESFTVTLSGASGTGTSIGAASTATVTITDEDSGVSFASPTYTVIEGGPVVSVQVNRIGNTAGAIGVTWTTANATAVAGQDFGTNGNPAQLTGTLTWAAGDAAAKTITLGDRSAVAIINDTVFESPETFTITLSAPTGGAALGPTPTTTVTIQDNESNFQFSQPNITVSEAGPNVTLSVTRTGSLALAQNVTYTAVAGTATATLDFTPATGVLAFAAGESSKIITIGPTAAAAPYIAVINDTLIEPPETFTVVLSAPTAGGVLGAPSVATVTIESDDRGITMAAATRSVPENAGSLELQVLRAGPVGGAIAVNYTFTNGTAINGNHYTATPGTLNWADGDGSPKIITVAIADDSLVNTGRTFTVALSGASGASLGTPTSTVVTIADDDNTVQFTAATAIASEGTPTLTLSVSRIGGVANPASVTWTTADGTALAGADFGASGNTAPVSGVLNWGAADGASKTVTIPILNDLIVEGAKTFTVTLSGPAGATIGTTPTVTVTLNDNDSGVVFALPTYTVAETAGTVTVTVNRIGPSTSAATVTWTTANGSAIAGQDFGVSGNPAQRSGTLSWAASDATARTIVIPIINDAIFDGADETFTIVLGATTGGLVLGTPSVTTVTILDDDIPAETELSFSQPKYLVLENAVNAVLSVNRTALPTYGFGRAATVSYATQPGTALVGSDYTARSGTLTWPIGDSGAKEITVPITNDAVAESPETFKVVLSAVTPGTRIATPEATIVIIDDDEVFPPHGAIPVTWTVPGGATAGWQVSNDPGPYEGVFALRSDAIGDNETAEIQVQGTFAAGMVTFRVRVSTEAGFDFLRFYVDGVKMSEWSGTANTAWQVYSTSLTAGIHTLRWAYEKDGNLSMGQDAAFLDAVTTPAMTP